MKMTHNPGGSSFSLCDEEYPRVCDGFRVPALFNEPDSLHGDAHTAVHGNHGDELELVS